MPQTALATPANHQHNTLTINHLQLSSHCAHFTLDTRSLWSYRIHSKSIDCDVLMRAA